MRRWSVRRNRTDLSGGVERPSNTQEHKNLIKRDNKEEEADGNLGDIFQRLRNSFPICFSAMESQSHYRCVCCHCGGVDPAPFGVEEKKGWM